MRIFPADAVPLRPADPRTFTGPAHTARVAADQDAVPVTAYRVEFEPGGRTHWHTHSGPQWLFVLDGRIRVQAWGEPARDLGPGDAVVVAPGEKHWHGATPGARGVHLAVNVALTTQWLDAVSDEEYARPEAT